MKYLLVKAWLGFGDRLQGLKMCVKYAQDFNRAILIDWSDGIFSHSGESFYTYFDLNMPTFKLEDLTPELTVYPSFWKNRLDTTLTAEMVCPEINIGYLNKEYTEDIIVYCCIGDRLVYNDSKFFTSVFKVMSPEIINRVKQRREQYNLSNKIGVHLRGTDRATQINKLDRFRGIKLRMLGLGSLSGQDFIAVSDDKDFCSMWKSHFKYPLLTQIIPGGISGNHHISPLYLNFSKNDLNIDMLVDFFTLASCKGVLSTSKDSRFAQEAQRLHHSITDIF
jgi:hypothetical protein